METLDQWRKRARAELAARRAKKPGQKPAPAWAPTTPRKPKGGPEAPPAPETLPASPEGPSDEDDEESSEEAERRRKERLREDLRAAGFSQGFKLRGL